MPKPIYIYKKPVKKPGRPTLLNPTRQDALLKAIEQGMPLKQAAAVAGISYDTLNHWQNRGENENAPIEYRQFCQLLQRSHAVAMQVHLSSICEAAKRDWKAAAWMLEKRFPTDFARPQQIEHMKPQTPTAEENYEVLRRIKKQKNTEKWLGKLGNILMKNRREKEEAARAAEEAKVLQAPLISKATWASPTRPRLRE